MNLNPTEQLVKVRVALTRRTGCRLTVGRFTSSDRHPGRLSKPISLNKFLYANADPLNQFDPSGFMSMAESGTVMGIMGAAGVQVVANYARILMARVAGPLLVAYGLGILGADTPILSQPAALNEARKKLQADTEGRARSAGLPPTALLFHYTDDLATARDIVADRCIIASKGYNHPDGAYRPSGAYATPIPPWFPWSIDDLRSLLYAKNKSKALAAFVTVAWEPTWIPATGPSPTPTLEMVKRGYAGTCVPVIPLHYGPNLMGHH